jgi:hypothetical protein
MWISALRMVWSGEAPASIALRTVSSTFPVGVMWLVCCSFAIASASSTMKIAFGVRRKICLSARIESSS